MREEDNRIAELREKVKVDPAGEHCVELARLLIEEESSRSEAREVLFAGIARDPHLALARLLLARSFYLDSMIEFAVRELVELQKYTDVPSLNKLLDSFGSYAMAFRPGKSAAKQEGAGTTSDDDDEEDVLAEIDIDDEFLDAIDEVSKEE